MGGRAVLSKIMSMVTGSKTTKKVDPETGVPLSPDGFPKGDFAIEYDKEHGDGAYYKKFGGGSKHGLDHLG